MAATPLSLFVLLFLSSPVVALAPAEPDSCAAAVDNLAHRIELFESRLGKRHNETAQQLEELLLGASESTEALQQRIGELEPRIDAGGRQLTDIRGSIQFLEALMGFALVAITATGLLAWQHLKRVNADIRVLQRVRLGSTTTPHVNRLPAR